MKYIRINEEELDSNHTNDNFFEYKGKPYNGIVYESGSVGNVLSELSVCNGLRNGHFRIWNNEGKLIHECFYRNNLKIGLERSWDDDGNIEKIKCYLNDEEFSLSQKQKNLDLRFDSNESRENIYSDVKQLKLSLDGVNVDDPNLLIEDGYFEYNGRPFTGVIFCNYENGLRKYEKNIRKGLFHGLSREWHVSGRLKHKKIFEKGVIQGECKEWYASGNFKSESNYMYSNILEQKIWDDVTGKLRKWVKTRYADNFSDTEIKTSLYDKKGRLLIEGLTRYGIILRYDNLDKPELSYRETEEAFFPIDVI